MSCKSHALLEFKAAKWMDEDGNYNDDMQELMCKQVLELLELFSTHGHSGSSAPYAINMFKTLANFEPLVPLTGEDWEWRDIGNGEFQNKRCSHVFKNNNITYDINGKIFREPDGCCYMNGNSRVIVAFPYIPKTEYIDVKEA